MKKHKNATAPRRATLKSVAAYLNISTATVSNAFNRPDQLSSQLREEVLAAASALGYRGPDSLGRSLRTGQSCIIGIMMADNLSYSLTDSVASELLSGMSEVLDLHGYRMLLLTQSASQEIRNEFNGISDGYLVYGSLPVTTSAALARGDFNPAVTIDMCQRQTSRSTMMPPCFHCIVSCCNCGSRINWDVVRSSGRLSSRRPCCH